MVLAIDTVPLSILCLEDMVALTNYISGIMFEHKTNLLEIRSMVTNANSEVECLRYGGEFLLAYRGEIFMEITKDSVSVLTKSCRHTTNLMLGGLGTGINITRDWMIDR